MTVQMPDHDEIKWLAQQFVRLVGKGTARDAVLPIMSDLEVFVGEINNGSIKVETLQANVNRVQNAMRELRKELSACFDHPHHSTWQDQMQKLRTLEWWAQVKRDVATLSADDRAGRQEELAWVQRCNDLARELDAEAASIHISAWRETLEDLSNKFVKASTGGKFKTADEFWEGWK